MLSFVFAEANCAKVFVSYWQLMHDETGINIICEDGDIAYEKVKQSLSLKGKEE